MFFFRIRWLRRLMRKTTGPIPTPTAEKWYRRLSFLYVFLAWNALGGVVYMTKTGRLDYTKDFGLKIEEEANKSKAIEAMEMLGIEKANVVTYHGFTKIREEEVVNLALEEEKRLSQDDV